MSELSKTYSPADIEDKWYQHWESKGYFHAEPDDREMYSIVIPPPNVTGILHMGHMLNNTIQDILIRRARLQGKNACWVPGTDHASIATEAKVVKWLREEKGLRKSDITRDEFMDYAWQWTEKYGGIILSQLRRLGASADWERTAFTMDPTRSAGVLKAFVDLYTKGKIYRGRRMVNWDPQAKTVLSNEEVLYQEEQAKLYKIKYFSKSNPDQFVVIATQRPETIMADAAIAVHPNDERYVLIHGQEYLIPLINKSIKIIADEYVDVEFGTGALKVTPAHDVNDYELGIKHQLEVVDILHEDGSLNESAQILVGLDRFEARKQIVKMLEEAGHLEGTVDYKTNIGRSERTNAVVEPRLSLQWFVDMKALTTPALDAVKNGEIRFFPKNQANTYNHWLENIRDWCISRQLWWGHRIPAYYYKDDVFVALTREEAVYEAQNKYGASFDAHQLSQDNDVLDTWFSSWLWPITVFDGFNPDSQDFKYFYPTSVLVTAWDIIFLWVARMIMAGYEWEDRHPFKDVYFTGMVRDQQRRKMSKSLGNSPDAIGLIDQYGADGVRFGMLSSSPAGGDLLFNEKLCEQGRNFCNKLWNALRLISGWEVIEKADEVIQTKNHLAAKMMRNAIVTITRAGEDNFAQYRLSENLILYYSLIWGDFCSWYLEMIKPEYGQPIDQKSLADAKEIFTDLMIHLHPFMPFITEEIYHQLGNGGDCMKQLYPVQGEIDHLLSQDFEYFKVFVSQIRDLRNKYGIKQRDLLPVKYDGDLPKEFRYEGYLELIEGLSFVKIQQDAFFDPNYIVHVQVLTTQIHVLLPEDKTGAGQNQEEIIEKIKYYEGFVAGIQKKLSNESFVSKAPPHVIELEKKKLDDGLLNIENLKKSLN